MDRTLFLCLAFEDHAGALKKFLPLFGKLFDGPLRKPKIIMDFCGSEVKYRECPEREIHYIKLAVGWTPSSALDPGPTPPSQEK
jgi:hypothetical protein